MDSLVVFRTFMIIGFENVLRDRLCLLKIDNAGNQHISFPFCTMFSIFQRQIPSSDDRLEFAFCLLTSEGCKREI